MNYGNFYDGLSNLPESQISQRYAEIEYRRLQLQAEYPGIFQDKTPEPTEPEPSNKKLLLLEEDL